MLHPIPAQGLLTGFTKHNGLWRLKGPRCGISTREVGRCGPVFPASPDRARKGPWHGGPRSGGRPNSAGFVGEIGATLPRSGPLGGPSVPGAPTRDTHTLSG